jgi:hypothetical protein
MFRGFFECLGPNKQWVGGWFILRDSYCHPKCKHFYMVGPCFIFGGRFPEIITRVAEIWKENKIYNYEMAFC